MSLALSLPKQDTEETVDGTAGELVQISSPRLYPGDRIVRLGVTYEFLERAPGGKKFVRVDTRAVVFVSNVQLLKEMTERVSRISMPSWLLKPRADRWDIPFEARSATEKRLAWMRMDYVKAMERNRTLGYPSKVREVIDDVFRRRVADAKNVEAGEEKASQAVIYKWLAVWDQPGTKTIKRLCFAESGRGTRGARLAAPMVPLVKRAIMDLWFTPRRLRAATIYARISTLAAEQRVAEDETPSLKTVRRILNALPPYAVACARHGARAADHMLRSVGKMEEASFPGEVYEVDAHKLDMFGLEHRTGFPMGRLWVTVVIDRCTRMIVGFHLHVEPPSSLTIAAALRNAFAPKLYMLNRWPDIGRSWVAWGLPTKLILDNGLENRAPFLLEGLEELGVSWAFAAVRTPEDKPYVERFFGTMARDYSQRFPGWTGANPKEKGDNNPAAMPLVTDVQADELLHRWVMIYNMSRHEGIGDIPERLWRERTEELEVAPIEDIGMLDVLLGEYAVRTLRRDGIFIVGLRYGDKGSYRPLEHIRTRAGAQGIDKARIRFDRSNLSLIHFQDPVTKEYFPVPSLDPEYTDGLTLARHRIIRRHAVERAKGYVSIRELCQARDDLQRRIDEMTGSEPMTEHRWAAMFKGLGSKGSWGEFYRLADAEYGTRREDASSIIDLMETDEGWTMGAAPSTQVAEPDGEPADTPAADQPPPPAPAPTDIKTRVGELGMDVAGIVLPDDTPPTATAPTPADGPALGNDDDLQARMAALGMD